MKKTIFFMFLILLLTYSCNTDVKLGDECKLLTSQSNEVTKVENKNLDCLGLDSDGICLSYEGNNPYCTIKCGPSKGCGAVECRFDEKDSEGKVIREGEACVDSLCYPKKDVCSETNPTGLCSKGTKCESGTCVTICAANEIFIQGKCTSNTELCSSANKEGLCATGSKCDNGECVPTGCEAYPGYECVSPINLKGHPFKNQNICVKQDDLSQACQGKTCSGHGKCKLVKGGGAECICDSGYIAKSNLTCEIADNPCANIDCSGNGTCENKSGTPECKCNDDFHQSADKKDCLADEK